MTVTLGALIPRSWRMQGPPGFGHALALALGLHALLLLGLGFGSGFSFNRAAPAPSPHLDVTLTQSSRASTPSDAEALAQFDQQGSGDGARATRAAPPDTDSSLTAEPEPGGTALGLEEPAVPSQALQVLAVHTESDTRLAEPPDAPASESAADTTVDERALLRARLQRAQRLYSRMPRTLRTTALSAQAASHAAYLADWISRVEAMGNQHYPAEARRQQLYGELQIAVTLLATGEIAAIEVLRSSGHALLDQAAQETLRRAAPFAPFPPDMAAEWDRFEILRTWQFVPGHIVNTEP